MDSCDMKTINNLGLLGELNSSSRAQINAMCREVLEDLNWPGNTLLAKQKDDSFELMLNDKCVGRITVDNAKDWRQCVKKGMFKLNKLY